MTLFRFLDAKFNNLSQLQMYLHLVTITVNHNHLCGFRLTGEKVHVMNFGSYNYLGFSQNQGPCAEAVEKAVSQYGVAACASRQELGKIYVLLLCLLPLLIMLCFHSQTQKNSNYYGQCCALENTCISNDFNFCRNVLTHLTERVQIWH